MQEQAFINDSQITLPPEWQPSLWKSKSFFDEASHKAQPILSDIINHPFIQELVKGTLDIEKNIYYTKQVALYLTDIARSLSLVAGRSENLKDIKTFLESAHYVLLAQEQYSQFYPGKQPPKSPTCLMYTSYMLSTASLADLAVAAATLLPSAWIHLELGKYITKHTGPHNPYAEWIKLFCSEGFVSIANKGITTTNQLAEHASREERDLMLEKFLKSSEMEYAFLDSSYKLEKNLKSQDDLTVDEHSQTHVLN